MIIKSYLEFKDYLIELSFEKETLIKVNFLEDKNIKIIQNLMVEPTYITSVKELLYKYINSENVDFSPINYEIIGTSFTKKILDIVKDIPYGKTMSYKMIGYIYKEKYKVENISYRAIGKAVGSNNLPIIIPCHRVIGSNNKIGGFHFNIEIKKTLLSLEGIDISKLNY